MKCMICGKKGIKSFERIKKNGETEKVVLCKRHENTQPCSFCGTYYHSAGHAHPEFWGSRFGETVGEMVQRQQRLDEQRSNLFKAIGEANDTKDQIIIRVPGLVAEQRNHLFKKIGLILLKNDDPVIVEIGSGILNAFK